MSRHRMRARRQHEARLREAVHVGLAQAQHGQLNDSAEVFEALGRERHSARALYESHRDATLTQHWERELWWKTQRDGTRRL